MYAEPVWSVSPQRLARMTAAVPDLEVLASIGDFAVVSERELGRRLDAWLEEEGLLRLLDVMLEERHDALELAILAAPTLWAGLGRAADYERFWASALELRLEREGDTATLSSDAAGASAVQACLLIGLLALLRRTLTDVCVDMEMQWRPGCSLEALDGRLSARIREGAARTALVFHTTELDEPRDLHVPEFLRFFDDRVAERVGRARRRRATELTQDTVSRTLPDVSLASVAQQLGRSERALQRDLEEEGTTYQAVLDGVRQELACVALLRGRRVGETGYSLGFSGPGAFIRAFKRWTGQTPGEWRRLRDPSASPESR